MLPMSQDIVKSNYLDDHLEILFQTKIQGTSSRQYNLSWVRSITLAYQWTSIALYPLSSIHYNGTTS